MSTQSARQPAYAGGVEALAVVLVVAVDVVDDPGIGVFQDVPDGTAAWIRCVALLTAAAARLLVVATGAVAVGSVVACAMTVAEGLALYGLAVVLVGLETLVLDAVTAAALRDPLPSAVAGAVPPAGTADAETWTNSRAAPTAAMDAARTRVLRRVAVMSGPPQVV